jgi:hypothetical protein
MSSHSAGLYARGTGLGVRASHVDSGTRGLSAWRQKPYVASQSKAGLGGGASDGEDVRVSTPLPPSAMRVQAADKSTASAAAHEAMRGDRKVSSGRRVFEISALWALACCGRRAGPVWLK